MRHLGVMHLRDLGVTDEEISRLLTHSSVKMTQMYGRPTAAKAATDVMGKLGDSYMETAFEPREENAKEEEDKEPVPRRAKPQETAPQPAKFLATTKITQPRAAKIAKPKATKPLAVISQPPQTIGYRMDTRRSTQDPNAKRQKK